MRKNNLNLLEDIKVTIIKKGKSVDESVNINSNKKAIIKSYLLGECELHTALDVIKGNC